MYIHNIHKNDFICLYAFLLENIRKYKLNDEKFKISLYFHFFHSNATQLTYLNTLNTIYIPLQNKYNPI